MDNKTTTRGKAMDIRERHRLKKLRRRRIIIARIIVAVLILALAFGLMHLVRYGVNTLLNKDVIFTTELTDTIPKAITSSLSADVENDLISVAKMTPSDGKVCYLTFDDGPNNTVTLQIADILRQYNAKATFFQVGSLIEAYPDVTRRLHNEGHLIGNHSYTHNYSELYATTDTFMNEVNRTEELITQTTGTETFKVVRFPGGSHAAGKYSDLKQQCKQILKDNGFFICDWNCLNGDAEGVSRSVDGLLDRVKETLNDQSQVIILMHDASSKKKTVESLPKILEYLIEKGYTFDTLDHMRTE